MRLRKYPGQALSSPILHQVLLAHGVVRYAASYPYGVVPQPSFKNKTWLTAVRLEHIVMLGWGHV